MDFLLFRLLSILALIIVVISCVLYCLGISRKSGKEDRTDDDPYSSIDV
jgi:hypothetical protein